MESTITAYRPCPRQSYIAREGYPFIAIALGAGMSIWMTGWEAFACAMFVVAAFVAFFFRNPERISPAAPGLVISPADGRILSVARDVRAPSTGHNSVRVSIFMSVFDVHINRFPVSARVISSFYHAGKFLVASLDKASEHNERNGLVLEDDEGRTMIIVQVAGFIARRIVCYVKEGDCRRRGDRLGLIRFGSRVDLYLPPHTAIEVASGRRVRGGETILGRFV